MDLNEYEWIQFDEEDCPCQGVGWAELSHDGWEQCPIHFIGQLHPQIRVLLLDEPVRLAEEESRALISFRLGAAKNLVVELELQLRTAQKRVVELELEMINRTPTKKMEIVKNEDPHLDIT